MNVVASGSDKRKRGKRMYIDEDDCVEIQARELLLVRATHKDTVQVLRLPLRTPHPVLVHRPINTCGGDRALHCKFRRDVNVAIEALDVDRCVTNEVTAEGVRRPGFKPREDGLEQGADVQWRVRLGATRLIPRADTSDDLRIELRVSSAAFAPGGDREVVLLVAGPLKTGSTTCRLYLAKLG